MGNVGSKMLATGGKGCAERCDCPLLAALCGGFLDTCATGAAFSSGVQHSLHVPLQVKMQCGTQLLRVLSCRLKARHGRHCRAPDRRGRARRRIGRLVARFAPGRSELGRRQRRRLGPRHAPGRSRG